MHRLNTLTLSIHRPRHSTQLVNMLLDLAHQLSILRDSIRLLIPTSLTELPRITTTRRTLHQLHCLSVLLRRSSLDRRPDPGWKLVDLNAISMLFMFELSLE